MYEIIQKIVYILQTVREDLGYDYGVGYCGSYCDNLAYTLRYCGDADILNCSTKTCAILSRALTNLILN